MVKTHYRRKLENNVFSKQKSREQLELESLLRVGENPGNQVASSLPYKTETRKTSVVQADSKVTFHTHELILSCHELRVVVNS